MPRPPIQPGIAGAFLEQAIEELRDSASTDALYLPHSHQGPQNRRLRFLRNSVLFSAIAAEATANDFLASCCNPADQEQLDREPTVVKLLEGPARAGYKGVFARGHPPIQNLAALSKARDRLVHPKPGELAAYAGLDIESGARQYGPKAAADYIVAVAHATVLLKPLRPDLAMPYPSNVIWEHRPVLERHVRETGSRIGDVPDPDAPPISALLDQMRVRAGRKSGSRTYGSRESPP